MKPRSLTPSYIEILAPHNLTLSDLLCGELSDVLAAPRPPQGEPSQGHGTERLRDPKLTGLEEGTHGREDHRAWSQVSQGSDVPPFSATSTSWEHGCEDGCGSLSQEPKKWQVPGDDWRQQEPAEQLWAHPPFLGHTSYGAQYGSPGSAMCG